jgi:hypothetical protein
MSFVNAGSQINDMAARTGLATDSLQNMKFAAEQTGTSLEDVEKAARAFVKDGGNIANFEAMGESIAAIKDPSERARVALDTFGKSGTKLIPMFQEFKSLKAASLALGPMLTDADVKAADALGDSFSALTTTIGRAMQQIGAMIGPYLQTILDNAIGLIASAAETLSALRNANSFGSGGDILDVLANSDLYNPSSWAGKGAAGRVSMPGMGAPAELEEAGKAAKSTGDEMLKSIQRANEARLSLIREFETPAEKFIAKQKEINEALKQLNRNRVLGFVGGGEAAAQRAALEEALRRLNAQEADRRLSLMGPAQAASMAAAMVPIVSSKGTFSAAGAGMLGRGSDSTERKIDESNRILRRIDDGIRRVARPAFS